MKMPYPSDLKGLLGMVNYVAKFIPNLPTHTLYCEKVSVRSFENINRQEIDVLKILVTKPPVLKYFDSKLTTKVSYEASLNGLAAVLEQKHNDTWCSVGYNSRTLTSSERKHCHLFLVISFTVLFMVKDFMICVQQLPTLTL